MISNFERRITTQLKSWLTAVGIGYQDSTAGLVVTSKTGEAVPVAVVVEGAAVTPGVISVLAKDLSSRNLNTSLEAFRGLQEALGYTPPKVPVNRGPIPKHKAHFSDDFELVAMRHNDFRRSPNPTNAELKSFQTVVDKATWWFWKKNGTICGDHGMELEDLKSYAMMWTCNYLGLYRDDAAPRAENEKNLCQYLKQRFVEFRAHLDRKGRNVLPMLDDAYIAMHGRPYEYTNKNEWYTSDPDADNDWEIPTEGDEPTGVQRDRTKKEAAAMLTEKLAGMPHDEMVGTLSAAVENDRIHVDARRAASKKLQGHAKKCSICATVEFPRVDGDGSVPNGLPIQDECGTVFANAKDAAAAHGVYPSNVRAVLSGRYKHTGGHHFSYVQPS
jgi:hypothetical protein